MKKKLILHLCADIGSDTRFYDLDPRYEVVRIGEDIGVENYTPPDNVHGIFANPVCTELSTAKGFQKETDIEKAMFLVNHCVRIIKEANINKSLRWWVIENPAHGRLQHLLGKPKYIYQPWQYGSPWTKRTALWGDFNIPRPKYPKWIYVPKNEKLYIRPGRNKPGLAFLHKSAIQHIPEFQWAKDMVKTDADFRSLCSQGFAQRFYAVNP